MAKARVAHSTDAATIIFEGDKKKALEPTAGIIKFPGGFVEVSRASDGTYWAHISLTPGAKVVDSRIDHTHEGYLAHGIQDIPGHETINHVAVRIDGPFYSEG